MVIEHVVLHIKPGQEQAFEESIARASHLVAETPGFIDLQISRSIETPSDYLLLIRWASVEAHMEGFRAGPNFPAWKEAVHVFYERPGDNQHFVEVHAR